ncbi:MAG: NAD-glutamate dehydrogenase [Deltaproteobacteria bacterium]|nr:NAD-glutamate dehydrogenase [Deltaproteobacteria bacterium]
MAQLQKAIAQLMERRQERPTPAPETGGLSAVLALLRQRFPTEDHALLDRFASALFAHAQPPLDAAPDSGALAAMAGGAFSFFRTRARGPLALRVFTPLTDRDGWTAPVTVIETVLDDRPFIVDTITALLEANGGEVKRLLHPQFGVGRGSDGSLTQLAAADDEGTRESFVHVEAANLPADARWQRQLADHLEALILVTGDHAALRERLAGTVARLRASALPPPWDDEREEIAAWLEQLEDERFVLLGYREYALRDTPGERLAAVRADSGLGLLRDPERSRWAAPVALPPPLVDRIDRPPLLSVSRTTARSPVYRSAPMDDLAIKEVDGDGQVVGAQRFLGLFTTQAKAEPASETPLLRRRLAAILAREGALEGSHDWRELRALFDSLPRELLLACRLDDVQETLRAIRRAEGTAQPDVRLHADAHGRGLFALVIVPRARFSTALHARVSAAVARVLDGPLLLEELALDERPVARLHYHAVVAPDRLAAPPVETLREALGDLLQTWDEGLRDALAAEASRGEAERLASRYGRALSPAYKAATDPGAAAGDVRCIEALLASGREQIELLPGRDGAALALRLFLRDATLALSDFVPTLEHLGLRVLGQEIVELVLPEGRISRHTFSVDAVPDVVDADRVGPPLIAALHAMRTGLAIDDALNALILSAGLDWRAVRVLRAYVDHTHQTGLASRQAVRAALLAAPSCAAALAAWFAARFDPAASTLAPPDRLKGPVAAAEQTFRERLAAVASLRHDRPLRALGAAVAATVRTNAYSSAPGAPLALKLDATRLPHLPAPRPAIEVWVHGVGLQGVHLRSGPLARGGIRFSDRPDDFRAEILALMRTQVMKNAVIVPVGAKGGFVLTGGGADTPDGERVGAAYDAFIDALLSITDSRERGQVVHPPEVLRYDGDDAYLVVAADKGTAAFSDRANALAERRGYWLGDAFASGGSHGYDHKRLGITARGAWECARQHFRELERDLDRDLVRVAGIGDMSGDVFGNGMLRSRRILLVAAFDHRHVFLDPAPDPERAARERERLFALPGSSWADYAPAAFSAGGGTYARDAKAIPLSVEARRLLGLEAAAPSGDAIVQAILRLPVDLLWNGGIGTYVKASDETHAAVADPANDSVRIDASELRATVVVEGGNLGLTQRARVEYALAGGHINTDAIDNSAGVDCSDHEVNIKIALQPLAAGGELTAATRARVLTELAEPVCDAVLGHNRRQARALSADQLRSRTQLAAFRDLVTILEGEAGLDRARAQLPSRDALRLRRGVYRGLTRPELAVLLAHTKLDLRRRLLQSSLVDDPELEPLLIGYFPGALATQFPAALRRHALRREIVSLELTHRLVDGMGMTFLVRSVRDSGHDVLDVMHAWVGARLLGDGAALEAELDAIDGRLSHAAAQRATRLLADGLERATLWLVDRVPSAQPLAALRQTFGGAIDELGRLWPALLPAVRGEAHAAEVTGLSGLGIAEPLAERLVRLSCLDEMLEITQVAAAARVPLDMAAATYLHLGAALGFDWLRQMMPSTLGDEDRWAPRAAVGLLEDLLESRRLITGAILAERRNEASVEAAIAAYCETRRDAVDGIAGLIGDLKATPQPTLPAVLVVLRELDRLARPRA